MMNFLKKFAHLYDKMDDQPDIRESIQTTTGLAVTRRYDLRAAGTL